MCNDREYAIGKLHDPKRVLESLVRGPRIHKIGKCQLVNVAQPLEWRRIENPTLVAIQTDEYVNRVPDFVNISRHCPNHDKRRALRQNGVHLLYHG